MSSFNGIGTTLYGKSEVKPDGSYITTKWFIFFLLPIFPLGSYRALPAGRGEFTGISQSTYFHIVEKVPLNRKQVLTWYLSVWLPLLIFIAFWVAAFKG